MQIIINSLEQLKLASQKIIDMLRKEKLLCLSGDLGSGKTTLSRYIIRGLLSDDNIEVTSPTFNLVYVYQQKELSIWHFDLYRLKHASEIYELGIEEALNNITIIEWPEIALQFLPKQRINLNIEFGKDENSRNLTVS